MISESAFRLPSMFLVIWWHKCCHITDLNLGVRFDTLVFGYFVVNLIINNNLTYSILLIKEYYTHVLTVNRNCYSRFVFNFTRLCTSAVGWLCILKCSLQTNVIIWPLSPIISKHLSYVDNLMHNNCSIPSYYWTPRAGIPLPGCSCFHWWQVEVD